MARVIGTASNMNELARLLSKRRAPVQSQAANIIRKYNPDLNKEKPIATVAELTAEWCANVVNDGMTCIDLHTVTPYEQAVNKVEFLTCLDLLLTEAEKSSHSRGYGDRRHLYSHLPDLATKAKIEADQNEILRAIRAWYSEASLPPIERFLARARKIELWRNEQDELTTLGKNTTDWRDTYQRIFLAFQGAIPQAEERLLRAAYTQLTKLLPTLDTDWLPRMNADTGEEADFQQDFSHVFVGDLVDYWPFCEFIPLQPTGNTPGQRDPCLVAWLSSHISVKLWYVWQALEELAGTLNESAPAIPFAFQLPVSKPEPFVMAANPPTFPASAAPLAESSPANLSLRQVALLYTYQSKVIPKTADSIARQHGHQSGAKLYAHYLTVSQRPGRIGDDITGQKLAPMIKDITAVIPHLSGAQQQQAENELKTLQARKETPV